MVAAAEAVDTGNGVLFIVKNYEGDVMNFQMAADMAGRDIETVLVNDDVAVEKSTYSTGRRGVAGTLVVERIVGAAAEQGSNLAQLRELGERVVRQTRSMGVALTSCTVPAVGSPTFSLGDDEMEMGVGIHGEPGRRRMKLAQADAIADEMLGAILADLDARPGTQVLLLVNGLGGTPAMELYVVVEAARQDPGRPPPRGGPPPCRSAGDVARHGRLLDHGHASSDDRHAVPVGRAAAHSRAALAHVAQVAVPLTAGDRAAARGGRGRSG